MENELMEDPSREKEAERRRDRQRDTCDEMENEFMEQPSRGELL